MNPFQHPREGDLVRVNGQLMRPGRYLKQYAPHLNDREVEFWANYQPCHPTDAQLLYAVSEDEIVEVYGKGPPSCMSGMDCVRIYAPTFQVAYLLSPENRIISRSLVNHERKCFARVYGSYELIDRMIALGYKYVYWDDSLWEGLTLQLTHDGGEIVCPYIDHLAIDIGNGQLILAYYGEYPADKTSGYLDYDPDDDFDDFDPD